MKSLIKFTAPIKPIPFKRAMTNGKRRYNSPEYTDFKNQLGYFALKAMAGRSPLTGSIKLYAEIYRNIKPDSLNFGDWDNHAKSISDALNGICYLDDRQIIDGHIKLFKGEPKIIITLEELMTKTELIINLSALETELRSLEKKLSTLHFEKFSLADQISFSHCVDQLKKIIEQLQD